MGFLYCHEIIKVPTKDRTSCIPEAVTVQAFTIQKVFVGVAGEDLAGTRPIQRVKVEIHWSLVVALKVGTSCKGVTPPKKGLLPEVSAQLHISS